MKDLSDAPKLPFDVVFYLIDTVGCIDTLKKLSSKGFNFILPLKHQTKRHRRGLINKCEGLIFIGHTKWTYEDKLIDEIQYAHNNGIPCYCVLKELNNTV